MAYTPTSANPYVTTQMLHNALYTVTIKKGPASCEKYIRQRYNFRLMIDDVRKKLLAVYGVYNEEIIIDINLDDIIFAQCLDAGRIKEERHRVQIITRNNETYDFYVGIPYQFDPIPFLYRLQKQINYAKNPSVEVRNNKISTVGALTCSIVFFIWTIVDWTNEGSIGWGIITLFLSIACGMAAYYGFSEWDN